jgi:hypothetical protein
MPGLEPSGVLPTALEFSLAQVPAGTRTSLMASAGALSAPKSSAEVKLTDSARFTLLNCRASFPIFPTRWELFTHASKNGASRS